MNRELDREASLGSGSVLGSGYL
nr:hypothetical protein [Tanacetum cinerariifolium]